jgi:uracil phosphoribosyltransferase
MPVHFSPHPLVTVYLAEYLAAKGDSEKLTKLRDALISILTYEATREKQDATSSMTHSNYSLLVDPADIGLADPILRLLEKESFGLALLTSDNSPMRQKSVINKPLPDDSVLLAVESISAVPSLESALLELEKQAPVKIAIISLTITPEALAAIERRLHRFEFYIAGLTPDL